MSFRAILYAYILGGFTLVPLLLCAFVAYAIYTSEPVSSESNESTTAEVDHGKDVLNVQDAPKTRKGWLTVRRTFEESSFDGGYVTLVRSFLDARSKDPKRSRPKDMWYVVLKGQILYLYEDETMTDCEAAIQLGSHDVVIYPEGLLDGELFTKRNSICLKPKIDVKVMPSVTREMKMEEAEGGEKTNEGEKARRVAESAVQIMARDQALSQQTPWFIFVRSPVEMEDWYFALVHASQHPAQTPTLDALQDVFSPSDMNLLVSTLDEQPDIIPMRWFNALFGRIFYGFYKTQHLESFIIGRLMKKLSKVKRPTFLNDILVTEVSVGNRTPLFSKPMLKELTKEGDASMEVHVAFKGEVRITIQATATINLGARFKPYFVKLVLAAVLRELEGNLLVKIKRPPSNRIWYAFTQMPKMVLNVEPVVSDRQITWNMILSTIESSLKTIILESIVMPNMDDIAFFDTVHREGSNRGGIWGDAARKHTGTFITDEIQPATSNTGPTHTQETLLSDGEHDSTDAVSQSIQKSSFLQESSSSTPEPPLLVASSTLPENLSSSVSSNRRKTWFSSVRSTSTDVDDSSDNNVETESRGRTLDADSKKAGPVLRSQSTPNSESLPEKGEEQAQVSTSSSLAAPFGKPRSASQSSSPTENDLALDNTRISQIGDASSLSVPASTTNTPPSPTNFLTTLKTRAADKQALSNTAKETMRKWGMKWGGLSKTSSVSSSSSHEDMPDHDTVGEGSGPTHSRSRTMSSMGSSFSGSQKARASYAEVRAAVAERRERAEHSQEHSPSRSVTPSSVSTPIAIPPNKNLVSQNAELTDHGSVSSSASSVLPSNVQSSSFDSNKLIETNGGSEHLQNQFMSISGSASISSSTSSTKSSSSVDEAKLFSRSHVNSEVSVDEAAPVHAPIHVQPQAKTMSIPGIHASHRGEVMSMGYVPPSSQVDKSKDKQRNRTTSQSSSTLSNLSSLGATSMGSLSKNPKIQSMYRLWKQAASNKSNSDSQDAVHQSSNDVVSEDAAASLTSSSPSTDSASAITSNDNSTQTDADATQTDPVLPASMSSLSKRVPPPPLPPRPSPVNISPSRPPPLPSRTPSNASRASTTSNSPISHQSSTPSNLLMPPQSAMSSAQDVLKEIASKDDHTRKRASLTLSSTPPSPTIGRRVSTTSNARSLSPARTPLSSLEDLSDSATEKSMAETKDTVQSEDDATRAWGLDDGDFVSEGA